MTREHLLATLDASLAATQSGDDRQRYEALTSFMLSLELLAREIARGAITWEALHAWAAPRADRLCSVRDALTDWEYEMGRIFSHGGEEEAELALRRRSQHALARELFRGTAAEELLASYEDEQFDGELRAEAERIAIDALDWVPHSHTWWRRGPARPPR